MTKLGVVVLISAMARLFVFRTYEDIAGFLSGELIWWVATAVLALLAAVFTPKSKSVRKTTDNITERSSVFSYNPSCYLGMKIDKNP